MTLALSAAISATIALLGWRLAALTKDGAVTAAVVGFLILGANGWAGLWVLGVFFVGSTAVSRIAMGARAATSEERKDEIRNWRQVLANGGFAAVGGLASLVDPGLGIWLVTVVLAAAAADTWATAFGSLSGREPVDVFRWVKLARGTSGGVTWFGTSGALMGAALVGLTGGWVSGQWRLYGAATGIGFLGMVLDSVLGSLVQARFVCPACQTETERRVHGCGTNTVWKRGWSWLDNDGVNCAGTLFAGLAGLLAWRWLSA